uniref:Uncharacterized protein n=1 Tax=Glossina palpalis gambiensis TaxID=67801 RepID=A0A1B0AQ25_9MUSC
MATNIPCIDRANKSSSDFFVLQDAVDRPGSGLASKLFSDNFVFISAARSLSNAKCRRLYRLSRWNRNNGFFMYSSFSYLSKLDAGRYLLLILLLILSCNRLQKSEGKHDLKTTYYLNNFKYVYNNQKENTSQTPFPKEFVYLHQQCEQMIKTKNLVLRLKCFCTFIETRRLRCYNETQYICAVLCSGNIIIGVQFRLAWCYEANFQVSSAMMLPLLLGNDAVAASAVVEVYIALVYTRMCKCSHDMCKYVRISLEWNALKNFKQQ